MTVAISSSKRSLARWTEILTPQGAALGASASSASMRSSHAAKALAGLALAAGTVPSTPALQASIASSGPETRNIGAAITGRRSLPSRMVGNGIVGLPLGGFNSRPRL
jgi:hypothetical protein